MSGKKASETVEIVGLNVVTVLLGAQPILRDSPAPLASINGTSSGPIIEYG